MSPDATKSSRLRLPSSASFGFREKKKAPRPSISGPIGPVHSSRGHDLSRSEVFTVVESIAECESTSTAPSNAGHSYNTAPESQVQNIPTPASHQIQTRRPKGSNNEIDMQSNIRPARMAGSRNFIQTATEETIAKPLPKSMSATSLLPRLQSLAQDENTPPNNGHRIKRRNQIPSLPQSHTTAALTRPKPPFSQGARSPSPRQPHSRPSLIPLSPTLQRLQSPLRFAQTPQNVMYTSPERSG